MNRDIEEGKILLGFLGLYETLTHDGYIGSILITDHQGRPQEFRCTYPIKPTTIQKPLYGETLEPHIGVNLCGIPLIQSIQIKPSLVVVNKDFLIDIREESLCPVVYIRRIGEAIDIKESNSSDITLRRERIDCSTGRFQPIIIEPHPNYYDDDINNTRKTLEKVFTHLDPIEPFERMEKAIEILGKQDKRFQ